MKNNSYTKIQTMIFFNSLYRITTFCILFLTCSLSIGQMKIRESNKIYEDEITVLDKSAQIVALTAIYNDSKTYLSWTVNNQVKEGTYLIERSEDGVHFTIEGIKKGIPTKRKKDQVFNFTLNEKENVKVYYRIKHIANNNSVLISRKVTLTNDWVESIY